ncbi:MAG: hypothetical protein O2798_01970 [Chloroflexi bacterium]|nr:hypothetical protein [Chloroflexota bacterium]MDA1239588.1 hypothetical protein [Chloroflexota bacterium]
MNDDATGWASDRYDPRRLGRSFDAVDHKLLEADYFLEALCREPLSPVEASFYFSAFVSAARSVTFALQAVMKVAPGFSSWYEHRRVRLGANPTARWFVTTRNLNQKLGLAPIRGGTFIDGRTAYWFGDHQDMPPAPERDVDLPPVFIPPGELVFRP